MIYAYSFLGGVGVFSLYLLLGAFAFDICSYFFDTDNTDDMLFNCNFPLYIWPILVFLIFIGTFSDYIEEKWNNWRATIEGTEQYADAEIERSRAERMAVVRRDLAAQRGYNITDRGASPSLGSGYGNYSRDYLSDAQTWNFAVPDYSTFSTASIPTNNGISGGLNIIEPNDARKYESDKGYDIKKAKDYSGFSSWYKDTEKKA